MGAMPTSDELLAELKVLHPRRIDLSLGRIEMLLAKLGNPQHRLPPVIHIAGTNGKGSTAALLKAMLEPTPLLREREERGDYTARLALQEEIKALPWGPVWEYYCAIAGVPAGQAWLDEVRAYENSVLSVRV